MADNPYAEFQQSPVGEEEQKTRTQKSAVESAQPSTQTTTGNPYEEFQKSPVKEETKAQEPSMLDRAEQYVKPVDTAITGTLAPNPENYSSALKTNAIEVPKTLGREVYGAGKTIYGLGKALLPETLGGEGMVGHAFSDKVTPEEAQQLGIKPGEENSVVNKVGAGLGRISGTMQMGKAAETYANPETRPTASQALEVLPEALGEGAGNVLGLEAAAHAAPKVIKGLGKIDLPKAKEIATAPVRAAARVADIAKNHPEVPGAVIGGVLRGPQGALEGAATGGVLGKATRRIPNTIIDSMKEFGKSAPKEKGVVGNEYVPKSKTEIPEAKEPSKLGRIEYAEPTASQPAPERVGNEYAPEPTEPVPQAKEPSKLGRIEYGEQTPSTSVNPDRVGNEHTEGAREAPEITKKHPLSRIEYAEPTEGGTPKNSDLVGNEHTEGDKGELPEAKKGMGKVEYAEPTPYEKPITEKEVKSSPGTSMAKEEKAPVEETKEEASKEEKPAETKEEEKEPESRKMTEEEQSDFDHEITSSVPMGPTALSELRDVISKHTDKPIKFLGAGNENTVFDLGNGKIAKVSKTAAKVPDLPEVLQPEAQHDIPAATGEHHVSIFPKVETESIPQSAINEMTKKLEDKGYKWDSAEGNIGRTADGKYVVIDSGGLEKIGEKAGEGAEESLGDEDHGEIKEQVSNLSNDDLRALGKEYGLNPDEYDFKRREPLREGGSKHPVERHQFVDDLMDAMPSDEKNNIGRVVRGMREEGTFDDAAKSSKGRSEAARKAFPKLRKEESKTTTARAE